LIRADGIVEVDVDLDDVARKLRADPHQQGRLDHAGGHDLADGHRAGRR
jgi:hypothetical protein